MTNKTKLIAALMAVCLVVTLGVFGILAVKALNMSVGGNITFTADGISFEVSAGEFKTTSGASYAGITTQTGKMQSFVMDTNTKQGDVQDKIDSWTNLELVMSSEGDAVLHFGVKNKMQTPLYVYITTNLGENLNDNMDILIDQTEIVIESEQTKQIEIMFDIIDTSINAGLSGFEIYTAFEKQQRVIKTQHKTNSATGETSATVDYFYVEMGTYNGEPVRWRYVADATGKAYKNIYAPSSLSGYYVLETKTQDITFMSNGKFDENYKNIAEGYTSINANDYGLSDIREYLTNESDGFLTEINLSADNEIYKKIQPRTVANLYSNIHSESGNEIGKNNTSYCLSLTGDKDISNQSDKLWLMSQKEVAIWGIKVWGSGVDYWLRSPVLQLPQNTYEVRAQGGTNVSERVFYKNGVRPAFVIV